MKWLKFAVLNVLRNRRRGLSTVFIVAVGTAGTLVGGGFGLYTYDALREQAARDNGHLILAHPSFFDQKEETPMEFGLAGYDALGKQLLRHDRVRAVLPKLEFSGLITNGDKSTVFLGGGIDPGEFKVKGPFLRVSSGASLSARPAAASDPPIMIGEGLAHILNAKTGDPLTLLSTTVEGSLNAQDVVVHGIFSVGVPELDKRALLTGLATTQSLLLTDKVSSLSVYLYETDDTERVGTAVRASLGELGMQTWLDTAFYYMSVRDLYNRIFGLLGIIILGMVFFAISSSVFMNVVERTREIGTLRAMGTQADEIVRNFVLEALVLGVISVAVGMIIAGTVTLFFNFAGLEMPPPPARSQSYPLVIYADPKLYAVTATVILALCVAAAWRASRRAAGKPIVEALAHV